LQGTASGNHHLAPDPEITKVAPVDCSTSKLPIQILRECNGKSPHDCDEPTDLFWAKELVIETGKYTPLWEIPFSRTTPAFKAINSCGLNPVDSIIYCTLRIDGSGNSYSDYIVRVDGTQIEFVAKVPAKGNSATFSTSGTYYWGNQKMYFIPGVHNYKGYPNQDHEDLTDLTHMKAFDATVRVGTDMVSVAGVDLDDTGDPAEYLVGMLSKTVQITKARLDHGFVKTWAQRVEFEKGIWLDEEGNEKPPGGGFGAAWNYNGKLYFAHNGGKGVFQIHVDDLDVMEGAVPIKAKRVGISEVSGQNDGVNCIEVTPPPFPDRGDCPFANEEVEPVDGECPEGSVDTPRE